MGCSRSEGAGPRPSMKHRSAWPRRQARSTAKRLRSASEQWLRAPSWVARKNRAPCAPPRALLANGVHTGTIDRRVSGRKSRIPASVSKIVAARFGKLQKRGGHDGADRVATDVIAPRVAAAVSKEPGHGAYRADFEPISDTLRRVLRRPPPFPLSSLSIAAVRCRRPAPVHARLGRYTHAPPIRVIELALSEVRTRLSRLRAATLR